MAKGGGVSPAPPRGQVYLPEWRRLYDRLLKMLREEHALAEELSIERAHLAAELELQRIGRREREEIFQARIQQIWRDEERRRRVEKAERAVLIGGKDLESRCYQKLVELGDSDAEDFRNYIATLMAENSELKAKLKEVESQAQLNENSVDHQQSGKDLRLELRKLKQAYKTLSSEKEKQISALNAEKDFVWNQFKTMEQDYIMTIKSKNIEAKQATEAAQKLQKNVDDLQVAAQKKDDEINRLQAEVTTAKEKMLLLEDELKQMHSVKGKDVETGFPAMLHKAAAS
ncbi:MAR-binding filament-like protein 1-1 [Panicum miliaceum]|uniref:MAR-binding filament-like protein 1-1 n=1 Tax=Panicum miliaceum TaxID=4540 RepID=A0A3L6SPA3_PANMI|nr:MAR-binding filament-like protein 1-1 [Panicum miliaceum]